MMSLRIICITRKIFQILSLRDTGKVSQPCVGNMYQLPFPKSGTLAALLPVTPSSWQPPQLVPEFYCQREALFPERVACSQEEQDVNKQGSFGGQFSHSYTKMYQKNKLRSIMKRWEYQTTWPASCETYMQVRKQQLELDMEQQTGSK